MASTTTFASPLGPIYHAHPSSAPSHTLLSLFRSSAGSRPAKRTKKDLVISSPVLQSTTNLSVAAPAYTATAFTAPRAFRRQTGNFPSSSSARSSTSSASSGVERAASPPPPYRPASFLDLDDAADESEDDLPTLREKALVDAEQVERRMQQWDTERRLCSAEKAVAVDARMAAELSRLGL